MNVPVLLVMRAVPSGVGTRRARTWHHQAQALNFFKFWPFSNLFKPGLRRVEKRIPESFSAPPIWPQNMCHRPSFEIFEYFDHFQTFFEIGLYGSNRKTYIHRIRLQNPKIDPKLYTSPASNVRFPEWSLSALRAPARKWHHQAQQYPIVDNLDFYHFRTFFEPGLARIK